MKTCEFILCDLKPVGKGKNRFWPKCGQPAFYLWTSRRGTSPSVPFCKPHGEQMAGNYKDELTVIK